MKKSGQEKRTGGNPSRRQVREISGVSQKSHHKDVLWAGDEQVKQLIDTSPIAMVVASGIEERVEWVNDKFIELFGYTIEDMPDVEHWWHLAYPDETYRVEIKSQWAAKVEQAIRKKSQIEPMEATVRCKDGSRRYIEFRLSAIGEKHIVTFVDLTERKRVEEELSASEAELRTLVNAMTDVIFVGNSEGRYLKIVDTSPSLLYKPSKELLGRTLHEVFPKDLADFFLNHLKQAINTQKSVNFEYSLPIGDKKLWFYATVSPLADEKILMVARDITDRKQAEESLRESEEKYRTIFEESFDGLFITSPSGKILDMNRKGVLMFGYDTKEEVQNLELAKDVYANPADRERILEMVNTQGRAEYEVEVKKKNGEIMITHCSLTAVKDETGAVSSYRGIIRDITDRKRAEDILRESEEKYRTLIQKIQAAVVVHGADTQILTSNSLAQELLGLTEDQMLGKTTLDSAWHFFLEDGTAMPLEKYPVNQVLASHTALRNFIVRVHRANKENNDVWVLVNADPVFGKEDELTQVIVTFVDITERKRAEDELRQNREATLQFSEQLAALQEVTNELSKAESSDVLCLQAVQLGRSRLGFDRVSIWFIEEHVGIMRGSFGTDERGELRDERNAQVEFRHEGLAWLLFSHKESKALVAHRLLYDHSGREVGVGDNAMAALWDGDEVIGVISVDNLFTGRPISEHQLEVLRLYATTLGHLITRQRAEEALRASENRFRVLSENAFVGIYILQDGRLSYCNSTQAKIFGYMPEELIGADPKLLVHPDDQAMVLENIRRRIDGEIEIMHYEFRGRCKDGSTKNIEVLGGRIDFGGKTAVIGNLMDITDRKRAEDVLRESEEKYRTLIQKIQAAVVVHGADTQILTSNSMAQELLGLTEDQMLGKTTIDSAWHFFLEDGTAMPPEKYPVNQVLASRKALKNFIVRVHRPNKENNDVWVLVNADPVFGKEDELTQVIVTFVDITERKRAEENLRQSEQKFRALAENIPNVVFQCKNNSRYTFLYLNEAIESLTGYPREDFLEKGLSFFDLYHPDDLKTMPTPEENNITDINNNPFHITYRIRHKSGEWRWVDEWGTGVENADGKVEFLEGIMVDITEDKQHELEREAIINVSAALREAATRTDILNVIMDQLIDLFKADGAVLALPDPQTGGFINEMGRGTVGEKMVGLSIPPGAGVCNWVIESKRPYCNNHADHDPFFYRSDLLGNSHCIAAVPLIAQEQAIGAVWIARRMDITEQELRLLNAIADIAANAVHRVTLHEQTKEQLQHLIALHQIDLAISANFDLNVTLNVFLRNVIDELKVDAASILLLDPITHTLDFAAGIGFRTRKIEASHVKIGTGCAGRAAQEYRTVSCPDLGLAREAYIRSALLADEEFISHYVTPLVIKGQVKGVLEVFHRQALQSKQAWIDYFETLATQAAIAVESASLFENLQRTNTELILAYDATIEGWSRALDLRDKETEGHTQRVTEMALELAEKMGMSIAEKTDLRRGALLHDIGKMGVPDSILLKPGPLSNSEWEIMRQHPVYAYQMLSPITYLKHALEIPYCHHEKWDGAGYPRGLNGEQIPLSARMFAIVDVFDALTSNRPYRLAWSRDAANHYIQEQSGKHFDPYVVRIFLESAHGE